MKHGAISTRTRRFATRGLTIATLLLPLPAWGVTASPHPFEVQQPSGQRVRLQLRGDEHFHWLEDTEGFAVVRQGEGYVYAGLDSEGRRVPTGLSVGAANPRAAGLSKGILPGLEERQASDFSAIPPAGLVADGPTPIAATGNVKNLVILMRFANHRTRPVPTASDVGKIFNAVGGHPSLAPTGSVRDFFLESSYGALTLDSTVVGWVDLPQTEAYYAGGQSGLTVSVQQAIRDALIAADGSIDFRDFDRDHDGFVDAIAFLHSGYGAEWGGVDAYGSDYTSRIWSHKWEIPTWTSAEGVSVSPYHVSPALWGTSGTEIGHIGVIAHETGHFFGLPDLYDTDGNGEGIGSYCLMANSWGFTGDQRNPPHPSAWAKMTLGWVTPTTIGTSGTYFADQVETSPTVFRLSEGYPAGEYLLIENRQPVGFESTMPQGGLAIWHVDETKSGNTDEGYPLQTGWPANNRHYKVALLQADGGFDMERGFNRGDGGDLFQGNGVSAIGPSTIPNTNGYQDGVVTVTDNRISSISLAAPRMSFAVATPGSPTGLATPTGLRPGSAEPDGSAVVTASPVTLRWNAVDGAERYEVVPFYWDWTAAAWIGLPALSTTTNSVALVLPVSDAHYGWAVRALDAATASEWSAFVFFVLDDATCSIAISPSGVSVPRGMRTGTVAVTALPGCAWTAQSAVSWLSVIGAGTGSGAGNVRYRVARNRTRRPRTGTITIAGNIFTVTQSAQR